MARVASAAVAAATTSLVSISISGATARATLVSVAVFQAAGKVLACPVGRRVAVWSMCVECVGNFGKQSSSPCLARSLSSYAASAARSLLLMLPSSHQRVVVAGRRRQDRRRLCWRRTVLDGHNCCIVVSKVRLVGNDGVACGQLDVRPDGSVDLAQRPARDRSRCVR